MQNGINLFNYKEKEVRVAKVKDEPYFIARDILNILEIKDTNMAMKQLDEDEKLTQVLLVAGQNRNVWLVSEAGLYSLIIRSNKQEAKEFKRWVTHDVLPSIRKHGGYLTSEKIKEALLNPDTLIELATTLKNEQAKNAKLAKEIKQLKPKADFYHAVADSKDLLSIEEVAKIVGEKGVGRNNFFKFLREKNILKPDNVPYQRFVDRGFFALREYSFTDRKGQQRVGLQTRVYQKGLEFLLTLIKQDGDIHRTPTNNSMRVSA